MKTYFIFVGFLANIFVAHATVQTSSNQDKPMRLYAKTYTDHEVTIAKQTFSDNSPFYGWRSFNHTDTFDVNYSDDAGGIGTQTGSYHDIDSSGNVHNSGYTNVYPRDFGGFSYNRSSYTSGNGYRDGGQWQTIYKISTRTVWHLQTGGKASSKMQNLFGLSVSAGKWEYAVDAYSTGDDVYMTSGETILSPNIQIGNFGTLNTNGILYKILPDNTDVAVTPYVANVDNYEYYYSPPQKYLSYFEIFDERSAGSSTPESEIGHVWWRFSTDIPQDDLQFASSNLTVFVNHCWGFYPSNGLFTLPGQLQNNDSKISSADIVRKFYIGVPDLISGLQYTRDVSVSPPVYRLGVYDCVDAAVNAGASVSIYLGGPQSNFDPWTFAINLALRYPGPWLNDPAIYP